MTGPRHRQGLTPELLLKAYAAGIFPMSEHRDDPEIFWVDPRERGVLPLYAFHVPKSLRKAVRRGPFTVTCDTAFADVIRACAEPAPDRSSTWINRPIEDAVNELHELGFAHSIETWRGDELVGGLYGVALGGAFFGESMFSTTTDASKVALVHLVARLRLGRFKLLDTQFVTEHLERFGAVEIPAREYLVKLEHALRFQAVFPVAVDAGELAAMLEQVMRGGPTGGARGDAPAAG